MLRPRTDKPRVIVLERGRLTEEEIAKAFAGNAGAIWYQALISKIEAAREGNLVRASRAASANNPLDMAGSLCAYEELTALLDELDSYAKKSRS